MIRQFSKLFLLSILFTAFAGYTNGQSNAPQSILNDFVKAWNTHNMKAFDSLYTDDAVWVTLAEVRLIGRENIVKDLEQAHTTWAKNVSIVQTDVETKSLGPKFAVIFFRAGFLDDRGQLVPDSKRALMIVVTKQNGRWKITAGQLAHPTPAE